MTKQQRSFEERKEKGGSSFDFRQPGETECISWICSVTGSKNKKDTVRNTSSKRYMSWNDQQF